MAQERTAKPPRVTERDKAYMRSLGRVISEANEEALRLHLSLSLYERLAKSQSLSQRHRTAEVMRRHMKDDDPSPLYARARERGLLK